MTPTETAAETRQRPETATETGHHEATTSANSNREPQPLRFVLCLRALFVLVLVLVCVRVCACVRVRCCVFIECRQAGRSVRLLVVPRFVVLPGLRHRVRVLFALFVVVLVFALVVKRAALQLCVRLCPTFALGLSH